ncbi:MAG: hypothetical protein OXJ55_01870, partial [Caldilineaceae bacterium]|nr:hypothetical protein [Caldilineaceae bacterium]
VGDPLVDEDEGGAVVGEQLAKGVAGVGGFFVVGAHAIEGDAGLVQPAGGVAQLSGEFAP